MILFGLCGHGNFDLAAYDAYLAGTLEDPEFSQDDLDAAVARAAGGRAEPGVGRSAPAYATRSSSATPPRPTAQRGIGDLPQRASRA